jgi:hypothetical protein
MEDSGDLVYDLAFLYFKLKDYSSAERVISLAIADPDGNHLLFELKPRN